MPIRSFQRSGLGVVYGTYGYMAPELFQKHQLLKGSKYNTAQDVFSLGLVLYEMVTGDRLFNGKTVEKIKEQNKTFNLLDQFIDIKLAVQDKGALDLILKMLPEDPNERIKLPDALDHYFLN